MGRIYTVSPFDGDKFYLCVLLNHVNGPIGFDNLLIVNGITHPTFKQAVKERSLLENDNSIRQCLLCWKNRYAQRKKNGSTSLENDNMCYVSFRIRE